MDEEPKTVLGTRKVVMKRKVFTFGIGFLVVLFALLAKGNFQDLTTPDRKSARSYENSVISNHKDRDTNMPIRRTTALLNSSTNTNIVQMPTEKLCISVVGDNEAQTLERSQRANYPWVAGSKLIRLDLGKLAVGVPLALTLSDHLSVTIVFESKCKANSFSNNDIWHGRIEGEKRGSVALVVTQEGIAVGDITVPGKYLFQIRYVSGDTHAILEIDEKKLAPCSGALVVPVDKKR